MTVKFFTAVLTAAAAAMVACYKPTNCRHVRFAFNWWDRWNCGCIIYCSVDSRAAAAAIVACQNPASSMIHLVWGTAGADRDARPKVSSSRVSSSMTCWSG
jgi:hypothetical protein